MSQLLVLLECKFAFQNDEVSVFPFARNVPSKFGITYRSFLKCYPVLTLQNPQVEAMRMKYNCEELVTLSIGGNNAKTTAVQH